MKYKVRHNLTQAALLDLLRLLEAHCPLPNNCLTSTYKFNKHFCSLKYPVVFHYYCVSCFQEVEVGTHICPNLLCKAELDKKTLSTFIQIPIESQLKSILESKLIIFQLMLL